MFWNKPNKFICSLTKYGNHVELISHQIPGTGNTNRFWEIQREIGWRGAKPKLERARIKDTSMSQKGLQGTHQFANARGCVRESTEAMRTTHGQPRVLKCSRKGSSNYRDQKWETREKSESNRGNPAYPLGAKSVKTQNHTYCNLDITPTECSSEAVCYA